MQAFGKAFDSTPDDLDMHVIYDVSHNIAKFEEHISVLSHMYRYMYNTHSCGEEKLNHQNEVLTKIFSCTVLYTYIHVYMYT